MITYGLEGINNLNDMLADLGIVLGKRVVRKAARKALQPVLATVKETAPVDNATPDGVHLKDSFKIQISGRTKKDQRAGNDTFLDAKVVSTKEVGEYVAQVEFGRNEGTLTKTNVFGIETNPFEVNYSAIEANPFMANALDSQYQRVVETFTTGILDEIADIAAKKRRRARSAFRARERRARQVMRGTQ